MKRLSSLIQITPPLQPAIITFCSQHHHEYSLLFSPDRFIQSSEKYASLVLICAMGNSFSSSRFSISREKVGCRKKLTLIPQLLAREVCRLRWQGSCTHQLLSCPSTPGADILPAASDLLIALFLVLQQSSCLYTLIHKCCGSCTAQGLT